MSIATTATHGEVCWEYVPAGDLAIRSLILFGSYRVLEVLGMRWYPENPLKVELRLRDADDATPSVILFGMTEGVRHILSSRVFSTL